MVICILLIASGFMPGTYYYAGAKERTAVVTDFSGSVEIMKSGSEKVFDAKKKMKLKHGDRIITGKESWITLDVDGDKEVKIGAKSYIALEELTYEDDGEKTSIKVFKGNLMTNIKKKLDKEDEFDVKTPNAVMGARGTKFLVSYEEGDSQSADSDNKSKLTVIEGIVQAVARATVKVKDESGALVEKQLTIAVAVEEGEDIELVIEKIQKELQSIADEVQAMDEQGEVNLAEIKKVIETKISNEDMDSMNVKELNFDELNAFAIESIMNELKNEEQTDESKQLLDHLKNVLDSAKKKESQEEQKQETLINQVISKTNVEYTPKTGSSNPPPSITSSAVALESARTIDSDKDGIIDKIRLTFSDNIDHNSLVMNGITLTPQNDMVIGSITNAYVNAEDSKIIDLAVSETANQSALPYNTGSTAKITIPAAAFRCNSLNYAGVSNYTVADGASPVLLRWNMDFNSAEKKVGLVFSEYINRYSDIDTAKIFVTDHELKSPIALGNSAGTGNTGNHGSFVTEIVFSSAATPASIIAFEPSQNIYCLKLEANAFKDEADNMGSLYLMDSLLNCSPFTADITKPTITSVATVSSSAVLFTFSEFMNAQGMTFSPAGGIAILDGVMTGGGLQIQLGIANLTSGAAITVAGGHDLSDNSLEGETYIYNGSAWTKIVPFKLNSAETYGDVPHPGVVTGILLTFNKAVCTQNFNAQTIISSGAITIPQDQFLGSINSISVEGNKVYLNLDPSQEIYNSGITGSSIFIAANTFESGNGDKNQETNKNLTDGTAPSFTLSEDHDFNNTHNVRINFSESMNSDTINSDTVISHDPEAPVYSVLPIGSGNMTFEIILSASASDGDEIEFRTGIQDSNGNPLHITKVIVLNTDGFWQPKN